MKSIVRRDARSDVLATGSGQLSIRFLKRNKRASALAGGIFLLAMDDIARSAVATEIPIGLLMAGIGTPFFAVLGLRISF
jgi:ABC-type Fe3+-siderophore transport system permease subunit